MLYFFFFFLSFFFFLLFSVVAIFALPLCLIPVFPEGELLHEFGVLIFMSGDPSFVDAVQGMPLNCLALEARNACVPGSHGIVTIRETVLSRLPLQWHCTESGLKHTLSLFEKQAYFLI